LERQVKATFLVRFGQFVEWPPKPPGAPFSICAMGDVAISGALLTLSRGERVHDRPVITREISDAADAQSCDILFLGGRTERDVANAAETLAGRPVLIVTDASVSSWRGMIHFEVRDARVRFHVDQGAAVGSGLRISSRLLNLALSVDES
jgi:hypothetical protein